MIENSKKVEAISDFLKQMDIHVSSEKTELRRRSYTYIKDKLKEAKDNKKSLKEIDYDSYEKISDVVNYYEHWADKILFAKENLNLEEVHLDVLYKKLHNSTNKLYVIINDYKEEIYPLSWNRPVDWADGFKWLHEQCLEYKRRKKMI